MREGDGVAWEQQELAVSRGISRKNEVNLEQATADSSRDQIDMRQSNPTQPAAPNDTDEMAFSLLSEASQESLLELLRGLTQRDDEEAMQPPRTDLPLTYCVK